MLYLASPYSGSPAERMSRYHQALVFTERHLLRGHQIFSPIVYGHPFAGSVGTSAAAWQEFNAWMIDACSEMWILTLPGWKESKGVSQEIATWEFLHQTQPRVVNFDEEY